MTKISVHEIHKYLSDIGRKGGEKTFNLHGKAYFVELSKKAVAEKKRLAEARREIRKNQIKIVKPIIDNQ